MVEHTTYMSQRVCWNGEKVWITLVVVCSGAAAAAAGGPWQPLALELPSAAQGHEGATEAGGTSGWV